MKKIILMRHGHAESFAPSDRERELTLQGEVASRSQARLIADFFSVDAGGGDVNDPLSPITIFHSPFVRTTQTAEQLAAAVSATPRDWQPLAVNSLCPENRLIGNNSAQTVLAWLDQCNIDNAVVISHQPLVSTLLALLVDANTANSRAYPMAPASAALLDFELAAAGCFRLIKLQHA